MPHHLIAEARSLPLERLSLETGSWDYFEPARRFYRRWGFRECGPFADYRTDPNSVFMTRVSASGFAPCGFNKTAASAGDRVRELNAEITVEMAMVSANWR